MFDRNYSALLVEVETEEDLDRLKQQVSASNLSFSITGCSHGWNFDYSDYATTIVTEVGQGQSFAIFLVMCYTFVPVTVPSTENVTLRRIIAGNVTLYHITAENVTSYHIIAETLMKN
jgi:hypothetical protein